MKKENFPQAPEHPKPRLIMGYRTTTCETFGDELLAIGRAVRGAEVDETAAYTAAISSDCFCGRCRGYAHCAYEQPRHIGHVLANVYATGSKSGALTALASRAFGEHKVDDVVLDLGIGAGTCTAGWDLERGDVACGPRLGVEIEKESLRLAHAVHDTLVSASNVADLSIPRDGRLIVLSGLVFNVVGHAVADTWATTIAKARDEFTWVDVAYQPRRHNRPDHTLESLGFTKEVFFRDTLEGFGGYGQYECEAMTWTR